MHTFLDLSTPAAKRQLHALNEAQAEFERRSWKQDVAPMLLLAALCLCVGAVIGACVVAHYLTSKF